MGIAVEEPKGLFTLQTRNGTYQMKVNTYGFLIHQYYGKKVEAQDMGYLLTEQDIGFSGNPWDVGENREFSLDVMPQEYTGDENGDFRIPSIAVEYEDGSRGLDLRYDSYRIMPGKYALKGLPAMYGDSQDANTLEIVLRDRVAAIEIALLYSVWEDYDIITRSVRVINRGESSVCLQRAASICLDFPRGEWNLMHFYGRHAMERLAERRPLGHGIFSVESVRGTSSHHHNPFIVLCDQKANEDWGDCYGMALVYSGNFEAKVEVDQQNQARVVMGIHSRKFNWVLEGGQEFTAPEVILSYSPNGFGAMSRNLHRAMRTHLCRGKYRDMRRPILINNWEATYFDFDQDKILKIAQGAAELGVEMLVLDDGWFGKRDSDGTGLGDWEVNIGKLKGGLKPLVDKVNVLGMKFGLWFEPEMISEDSDLYRRHPDWVLRMPGREPVRSRSQLVLDMSRTEVRDYIFEKMCLVLDSANIEYIKWDMNRSINEVYSDKLPASRQGEAAHRYVLGIYEFLEKLIHRYPELLLEGCSGGGGRFDAGMLYYSPQIWCSDNTDAIDRIKIQYGTSFGYPISAMGSHVSAVPNHQTGRITPLSTRAVVAMAGSFGYELDLNKLTEEEKHQVKQQIQTCKKYWKLIHQGDYYRLTDPFRETRFALWQFVSPDKGEALVQGAVIEPKANMLPCHICLRGLDGQKRYRVNGDRVYTGAALMNGGILLPQMQGDYQPVELYLEEMRDHFTSRQSLSFSCR
ncbi:MAG: alpha-galactosidase [Lachnospiraceae bacterium]|jgi:alpha-galactosidase|nr:alpha-galactosidase [Lachnospiraceae bacterium]